MMDILGPFLLILVIERPGVGLTLKFVRWKRLMIAIL